jgi:carbon monoxide dehydrogenase subunit G
MVNVHLARDFDISAERVWALLEDFGDINWAPGIDRIEVIGDGIGMTRRLHIAGMDPIDEVLTAMDKSAMTFAYDIPRGIPMPVTQYSANAKVTSLGEGRCHVDWYGRAEPAGVSEKDVAEMISGAYEMLLQWINDHLSVPA